MEPRTYGVADVVRLTGKARSTVQVTFDQLWPDRRSRLVSRQELDMWAIAMASGERLRQGIKKLYIQTDSLFDAFENLYVHLTFSSGTIVSLYRNESARKAIPSLLEALKWLESLDDHIDISARASEVLGRSDGIVPSAHLFNLATCATFEKAQLRQSVSASQVDEGTTPSSGIHLTGLESIVAGPVPPPKPNSGDLAAKYRFADTVFWSATKEELRSYLRTITDLKTELDQTLALPLSLKPKALAELGHLLAANGCPVSEFGRYLLLSLDSAFSDLPD